MTFEILEHPADIGFRAWGDSPAGLFENAALALESIAIEMGGVEPRQVYPIAAAAEDYESLLVAWLNEVLYYLDGERVVMSRFEIDEIEPERVSGKAWGEPRDAERHPPRLVVKGVTFHQLLVKEEGGQWTARVFLDV
jgi:SHS2 domain-containing protein